MIGRRTMIGSVLATALGFGGAMAGAQAMHEAAYLPPQHPHYFTWEACAGYLPRWLGPFMRGCVAEIRAAQTGAPAPANDGMARFLICSYGMLPSSATRPAVEEMRDRKSTRLNSSH